MITPLEQMRNRHTRHDPSVVLVKDGYAIILGERAKDDMKKIADAAGVRMQKNAHVALRRGMIKKQIEGVRILNTALRSMAKAGKRDVAILYAGIATGYANAMNQHGLLSDDELTGVIEIINQTGKDALHKIEITRALF